MRMVSFAVIALFAGMTLTGILFHETGDGVLAFKNDILINLDGIDVDQGSPDIAVRGLDIYVVWQDRRNGNWDIYLRASNNGGHTFGPEIRVDDTSLTPTLSDDPSDQVEPVVRVDNEGTVYVAWADSREGRPMIFLSRSTDSGKTFSSNMMVSNHMMGRQTKPHMDISPSNKIMIVWEDTRYSIGQQQVMGAYSTDGETFTEAIRISDTSLENSCLTPKVAFSDDNNVHVVWTEERLVETDVLISSSTDGGDTFRSSYILNRDPSSSDQTQPDIDANATNVAVVWTDTRSTSADIYMAISTDRATSFAMEELVHKDSIKGHQVEPRVKLEHNGNISISWTSAPGLTDNLADIQMTRYNLNGTYDEVETVNDPGSGIPQDQSSVDTARGITYLVWRDFRNNAQPDIYFTRSIGSGQAGQGPELINGQVNPPLGGVGTKFTFKVTYSDFENDAPLPGYPKLDLYYRSGEDQLFKYPGSPFNMTHLIDSSYNLDYRDGETYIHTITPTRELDLYHSFRAKAISGNITEVSTDLVKGPMLDLNGPVFEEVNPNDMTWIKNNIVEFNTIITDDISGVDPWSTFFQRYNPVTMKWDNWQRKGRVETVDNNSVRYTVNITLFDGDENRVRFRASDMVGNGNDQDGYTVSPTYNIWIDPFGPLIDIISPAMGTRLNYTDVRLRARLTDEAVGLDTDSVNITYSLGGPDNYGEWVPVYRMGGVLTEDDDEPGVFYLDMNLSLTWGYNNFFKIRARDLLGNEAVTRAYQVAIIKEKTKTPSDRPPLPVSSIQPKVSGSVRPHITWTPTYDPDGDLVSYWFKLTDAQSGEPVLDWTNLGPAVTYWDPDEDHSLSPSGTYKIEIVPHANGLNGTLTNSTLKISPDANMPPEPVSGFEPRATSDPSPVLRWEPSRDPEGDMVIYFLRIGRFYNGGDILEWTSTFTDTVYRVNRILGTGMYHVQIMCSDGIDFSTISHFTMSIGIYSPEITSERTSVVIYPPENEIEGEIEKKTEKVELTVFNKGFTFDNIRLTIDGEATRRDDMEIYITDDMLEISPGSATNTTLIILINEDTKVGLYTLNITATSLDGVSAYTKAMSIRIVDPDDIDFTPGTVEDGGVDDAEVVLWLFFALLLIIVMAMGYGYYRIDRRQREEEVEMVSAREGREIGPFGKQKALGKMKKEKASLPPTKDDDQ